MKRLETKSILLMIAGLIIISLLTSCAGVGLNGNDPLSKFIKMEPKQKATVAMDLYNKVYDDTMKVLVSEESTIEAKKLAIQKAKILGKYATAINYYNLAISAGVTPDLEDEEKLIAFVNELIQRGVEL